MKSEGENMKKYIALLRGINVGGKNKISMKELKELFVENGYSNVYTYINSGNVIFSSDDSDSSLLKSRCEAMILERFQYNLSVMVLSEKDLTEALKSAPDWWDADQESKHNAIFVIPPITVEEVLEKVGEAKPEYEKVSCFGRVIFWSAPKITFSKTRWSGIVGTSVYDSITIRNANTAKKLAELCESCN